MKSKKIISLLLTSIILLTANTSFAFAKTTDVPEKSKTQKVLYKAKEITDINLLVDRAQKGIDDFKTKTGRKAQVAVKKSDNLNVESYQTSQLLSVVEDNGIQYQQFAITTVSYVTSFPDTESRYGCTLVSTIYAEWGNVGLKMLFSTHSVSGTGMPLSLIMQNSVYTGWDTMQTYYNSQPIAQPGGSYSLVSPYSGEVFEFSNLIQTAGQLHFSDGTYCETWTKM
jgi:hypothetical protein